MVSFYSKRGEDSNGGKGSQNSKWMPITWPTQRNRRQGQREKRGEGEVFPHEIPAAEWPEWRKQDEEEFKKIVESGALRVLSIEESKQVWERLKARGQNRQGDSEQNGEEI